MNRFESILLPLDGSPEAAKGIGCALWLAMELGATLHVVHATMQPLPVGEALERLRVKNVELAKIVVHQLPSNAASAVLDEIAAHRIDLVVMSAGGESTSAGAVLHNHLGTVARAVIERCPVPVLLLPLRYHEVLPWTSMLAAASGEAAADQALESAVRLAAALRLKVTAVRCEDAQLATYADMMHYEYPRRMEEMARRGLAGCANTESHCVEQVLLRRGTPADVLLQQVASQASSVLALGWHGAFGAGRALVLKRLLEEATCALLLVRGADGTDARLMVGEGIGD